MPATASHIAENLHAVQARMAAAARASGRPASAVRLLAVTKSVGEEEIRALAAAGCLELGESRPQDLWEKARRLADLPLRWHLVGHLQRNKVRRTLPLVELVHSADSLRLLTAIDKEAAARGVPAQVLLEVNVSGDVEKHGFAPGELPAILPALGGLAHVQVRGLMAMASRTGGLPAARRNFAELRELRDRLSPNCPPNVELVELSMGMSGDFEVAIEEGATIVRVGSALFARADE